MVMCFVLQLLNFPPDFPHYPDTYGRQKSICSQSSGLWLISVMLLCLFTTSNWRYLIINSVWRLIPRTVLAYTQNQSQWLSLWSKIFSFSHHDWLELPDWGGAGDDPVGSEERCWAQTYRRAANQVSEAPKGYSSCILRGLVNVCLIFRCTV